MRVTSATGDRGFTLLELLVVLTIMVLLAAAWPFAAPRLFPAQQLRNTAQSFVADARLARLIARTTGARQEVKVESGGTSYTTADGGHALRSGILMRIRGEESSSSPHLDFYPDGSSSGAIVDLALPSRSLSIAVSPLTGQTEILE
jgi:prepilin-type N-terminal cleavage/methylation domain-containing protein